MGTRTQDLIFTLYGDYLRQRGGPVWIGSLIELLAALGVSEQAVRSTASRMARKGWLQTERQGRHSFYSLTPKARRLLDEGARQIFQPPLPEWDGRWYLLIYTFSDDLKHVRHQLRKQASWLGFGQLGGGTLISPRDHYQEVQTIVEALKAYDYVNYFGAETIHFTNVRSLACSCWDLEGLGTRYRTFINKYQPQFTADRQQRVNGRPAAPAYCFSQRFWLIHEYRYFPFHDPYLPPGLLPEAWPGETAVTLFQNYHALLESEANAYVDDVLARAP